MSACGTSSSFSASGTSSSVGRPQVHGFRQRIGDTSADPYHGGLFDAELHGNGVGGFEANAADIPRKAIGILGHDLDGVGTIGLEDPYRPRRADAVAVQEDHDLANHLLLGPGRDDPTRSRSAWVSMTSNTFSPKARRSFLA